MYGLLYRLYFRRKYLRWKGYRRKKTKIFAAGAGGEGIAADDGADGEGNGGGVAASVLAGWLVLNKSKIKCAPLSIVLF